MKLVAAGLSSALAACSTTPPVHDARGVWEDVPPARVSVRVPASSSTGRSLETSAGRETYVFGEEPSEWHSGPACRVHQPCAPEPVALPECDALNALPWSQVETRGRALSGHRVSVEGALYLAGWTSCTLGLCRDPHGCCNQCSSRFALGNLSDPRAPYALLDGFAQCEGDESRLCCPVPAEGQRVVVSGTLGLGAPLSAPGHAPYWIRVDSACAVRTSSLHTP